MKAYIAVKAIEGSKQIIGVFSEVDKADVFVSDRMEKGQARFFVEEWQVDDEEGAPTQEWEFLDDDIT